MSKDMARLSKSIIIDVYKSASGSIAAATGNRQGY